MKKKELQMVLQKMDHHLKKPTRLHIRGGAACMLHGENFRATMDIDTIPQESEFDPADLAQACKKAGILMDPTSYKDIESGKPYLQLLPEETLVLPKPRKGKELTPFQGLTLKVTTPEPADLLVTKLKRCDAIDIQDIAFLILAFDIKREEVKEAFNRLPDHWKEDIILKENLENTLGDFFEPEDSPRPEKWNKRNPKKNQKIYSPMEIEANFA